MIDSDLIVWVVEAVFPDQEAQCPPLETAVDKNRFPGRGNDERRIALAYVQEVHLSGSLSAYLWSSPSALSASVFDGFGVGAGRVRRHVDLIAKDQHVGS